jgi:hypothetical protein
MVKIYIDPFRYRDAIGGPWKMQAYIGAMPRCIQWLIRVKLRHSREGGNLVVIGF